MKTAVVPLLLLPLFAALFVGQNAYATLIDHQSGAESWLTDEVDPPLGSATAQIGGDAYRADDAKLFELDTIITQAKASHFYNFSHRQYDMETPGREEALWGYARLVAIPEPASGASLGLGLIGLLLIRRRGLH